MIGLTLTDALLILVMIGHAVRMCWVLSEDDVLDLPDLATIIAAGLCLGELHHVFAG